MTTLTATVSLSEQPGVTYYVEMSRDGAEADYYDGSGWDDVPAGETVDAWMDYAKRRMELPTAVARAGLDWSDADVNAVGWSQGPGHAPSGIRLVWSW